MSGIPLAGKLKVNAESYRHMETVIEFPGMNVRQPCWNQLRIASGQVGSIAVNRQVGLDLHWSLPLATSV